MLARIVAELMLWAVGVGAALPITHEAALTVAARLKDVARAPGAM